jgi:hypothetical protein
MPQTAHAVKTAAPTRWRREGGAMPRAVSPSRLFASHEVWVRKASRLRDYAEERGGTVEPITSLSAAPRAGLTGLSLLGPL